MPNWMVEFLYVVLMSKRCVSAFLLGIILFFLITAYGHHALENFQLQGVFKGIEDVIRDRFLRRYDKIALGALVACWILAIKFYIKDKKRFL